MVFLYDKVLMLNAANHRPRPRTVDDLNLMEGLLRPKREVYVKDRVSWVHGVEGARQSEIME
ncbi:hypothetical protein J4E83_002491 [Alternaria metachromatica]|uniref:uncharacterized protein n=1 Tax=Alternaria metachromatica TaxID=283354 RepID=UPI0020C1F76A|nr:uncharacterized protein J4E83_002491 [Alternaria metachromatica]KAI4630965.1 hypothetical protein J4E83_002491 [Alternaria metachromatica]